jgi:peptidoglycan/xylan/chitin deacetylase (PgdA/CDA1 family)
LIGAHPRSGPEDAPTARRVAGAGALALAVAVPHAGPALAPIVPAVGRRLPVVLREEGVEGVALTFDDGPHPQGTPAVLEILREAGQTATFFLAGEQVEQRPTLAAEIVAAGHRVELHCHRHRNQLRLTPRMLLEDAERGRAAIEEASGQSIADYRPPYGIFSGPGLVAIRARGWRPQGDRWDPPRGHRPIARCGLLQRAELLGAHRVSSAEHSRRAGDAWPEVERASPLNRRSDGPLVAACEGFVELPGHRAPWPVLIEDLLGHGSPSSIGGFHKCSPPSRTKKWHFADFANGCSRRRYCEGANSAISRASRSG